LELSELELKILIFHVKQENIKPALVAHTCNPRYSGGRDQKDHSSKSAQAKLFIRPYLDKTHHKKALMEWLKVRH
jgi:hypothetical protein